MSVFPYAGPLLSDSSTRSKTRPSQTYLAIGPPVGECLEASLQSPTAGLQTPCLVTHRWLRPSTLSE